MKKQIAPLLTAILLMATAGTSFAKGGGMGHGGDTMGGKSASHFSSQGLQNTNGPNAADRDRGLERAQERMSDQGLDHAKAEASQGKHRDQGAAKHKK